MKFSRARIIYSVAVSLLLLFGIITCGLAAKSSRRIDELSRVGTTFPHTDNVVEDQIGMLMYKPKYLVMGPTKALVAAGVVSWVSAFVACIGIFIDNMNPRLPTTFTVITCFSFSTVITTLATIIYTMTEEKKNPTWKYIDMSSSRAQFTLESWFCQLKDQPIGHEKSTFATSCRDLTTARFLNIPLFILALGISGSAALTAYRRFL